jgi:hypothetical protein
MLACARAAQHGRPSGVRICAATPTAAFSRHRGRCQRAAPQGDVGGSRLWMGRALGRGWARPRPKAREWRAGQNTARQARSLAGRTGRSRGAGWTALRPLKLRWILMVDSGAETPATAVGWPRLRPASESSYASSSFQSDSEARISKSAPTQKSSHLHQNSGSEARAPDRSRPVWPCDQHVSMQVRRYSDVHSPRRVSAPRAVLPGRPDVSSQSRRTSHTTR